MTDPTSNRQEQVKPLTLTERVKLSEERHAQRLAENRLAVRKAVRAINRRVEEQEAVTRPALQAAAQRQAAAARLKAFEAKWAPLAAGRPPRSESP